MMAALKKEQGDRLLEEDEREWRRKVRVKPRNAGFEYQRMLPFAYSFVIDRWR